MQFAKTQTNWKICFSTWIVFDLLLKTLSVFIHVMPPLPISIIFSSTLRATCELAYDD